MSQNKSDQDKAIENAIKQGKCQVISGLSASQFTLGYDREGASYCIFCNGKKKPTKRIRLDVELLKFIDHSFTIVVIGNRFNFYPVAQEDLLFDNPDAINRKKLNDAQTLIETAIETFREDAAEELRHIAEITVPYSDFKFNEATLKYVYLYDLRSNLKPEDCHIKMDVDDFVYTCEYYGLDEKEVFDLAKSMFHDYEGNLTFDDIFPGANPIFEIEMSPILFSLMKEANPYQASLKYDEMEECMCYDHYEYGYRDKIPENIDKHAKIIDDSGLFQNHTENIFKYIQKTKNQSLKRAFIYSYLLAFDYKEIKGSLPILGGNSHLCAKVPNALKIHTTADTMNWDWLKINFDKVYGGVVLSFRDSNHTYSEGYYDWWGSNPTHTSYVVPYESKYSNRIKIYLFSLSEDKSTYVFHVSKDKVIPAMFFLWAYFASNVIDNKRQDNLLNDFFRRENIGWMEKIGAIRHGENGYIGKFM
ncbi:MAG: hypothetical protein NC453_19205 [Muribaculum sp.]|nr:hypothetical protein [Muribaculum sp.]